jgi:hypothetical protein
VPKSLMSLVKAGPNPENSSRTPDIFDVDKPRNLMRARMGWVEEVVMKLVGLPAIGQDVSQWVQPVVSSCHYLIYGPHPHAYQFYNIIIKLEKSQFTKVKFVCKKWTGHPMVDCVN